MLWNTSEFRQRNTSSPEEKSDNNRNSLDTPDRTTRPAKHNLYGYRTPPRSSSLFASSWTLGQAVMLAALCSSISAILTAVLAIYCFADVSGSQVAGVYSDQLVTTRITRSASSSGLFDLVPHLEQQHPSDTTPVKKLPSLPVKEPSTEPTSSTNIDSSSAGFAKSVDIKSWPAPVTPSTTMDDGPRPQVAWLMSFPNSGTSFTLHMTREASNCTTATNYALEGEIRDKPSVQAIPGEAGEEGPFLELIPGRFTTVPQTMILTKTHCTAFCTARLGCGPNQTFRTTRTFMTGCLSGTRADRTENGLEKIHVTYDKSLVKKAIHIFRHPLDNIVARFHLDWNMQNADGNARFSASMPKNAHGFRLWCANDDKDTKILKSSQWIDKKLKAKMELIPCRDEFYRYVQWHNLAFSVSRDMNLPTMILHYHEYSTDFEKTRDRVLQWLELPRAGEGIEFESGKTYSNYYSLEQKLAIRDFIHEMASAETWEQLKDYDFGLGDDLAAISQE